MAVQTVNVTNEANVALGSVVVEAINPNTGKVVATAISDRNGVAVFRGIDSNQSLNYNARISRRAGVGRVNVARTVNQPDPTAPSVNAGKNPSTTKPIEVDVNLIFTSAPKQITAGGTTSAITVQRVNLQGIAISHGILTVYLYTSSPTGTIPATLTIADGSSSNTFTYTDTTGGNPVLTASTQALT